MRPDEAAVREHLASGPFRLGEAEKRWRNPRLDWPHLVIDVAAAKRADGPAFYSVRFELTGYPQAAPLAVLWNTADDILLPEERWPTGPPKGRPASVFRPDWAQSRHGLYAAVDRSGITTHPKWRTVHAAEAWTPSHTLTDYLEFIHELLASPDYTGPRRPWPPNLL